MACDSQHCLEGQQSLGMSEPDCEKHRIISIRVLLFSLQCSSNFKSTLEEPDGEELLKQAGKSQQGSLGGMGKAGHESPSS